MSGRAGLAVIGGACSIELIVQLALVNRYGYHGDELYFLDCGRHLAFGYVDHPPLVPWLARLSEELGGGLLTLRLPAIVAGAGTLVLSALLAREWGGGWRSQLLTVLALLIAPAQLRIRAMLNIPVLEVLWCTATAYLVVRAVSRHERWSWVFAGGALGLALLAKHSALLWGVALAIGLLATHGRALFASRWPWLGIALAVAMLLPNLIWQAQNGFPTLEFLSTLRGQVLERQGRALFAAGQLLYFHPVALPIWVAGVASPLRKRDPAARPFALIFLLLFGFFLLAGGKPYYLASAYPPVLAAGGVALERWFEQRVGLRRAFVAALASTGAVFGVLTMPVLPLQKVDAILAAVLGWVVPPMALTHDLHGMFGWREHAAVIDSVYRALPAAAQHRASVLAGSYSQAGALNLFRAPDLPRAVSGHMTYYLWGPDPPRGDVLIAYGVPLELLERHYETCLERGRIEAPLARPGDTDLPVYVCQVPRSDMATWWPELRRYGHGPPSAESSSATMAPRH
jgi:4-amino-4-deoxy-L-arabinose transferase-like glycosyltransferase